MFCGTPGYVPTEEEREEAIQMTMAFHAWMVGLPDPRSRLFDKDAEMLPPGRRRRTKGTVTTTKTTKGNAA